MTIWPKATAANNFAMAAMFHFPAYFHI